MDISVLRGPIHFLYFYSKALMILLPRHTVLHVQSAPCTNDANSCLNTPPSGTSFNIYIHLTSSIICNYGNTTVDGKRWGSARERCLSWNSQIHWLSTGVNSRYCKPHLWRAKIKGPPYHSGGGGSFGKKFYKSHPPKKILQYTLWPKCTNRGGGYQGQLSSIL